MESFKQAAFHILASAINPMHYRDITQKALDQQLLSTEGRTPWATMSAALSQDIIRNGEKSVFMRSVPGYYGLRKTHNLSAPLFPLPGATSKPKKIHPVVPGLISRQKGELAEARVADLITLYGTEGLTCYRPLASQEGIDLIVKRNGKLDVCYLQVKSSFGYRERGFVSTVKEQPFFDHSKFLLVFVYFDLSAGDLYDHVFCVPGPDFLRLTQDDEKKSGSRVFTVGLSHPEKSKFAEFLIEKRELANWIVEWMDA